MGNPLRICDLLYPTQAGEQEFFMNKSCVFIPHKEHPTTKEKTMKVDELLSAPAGTWVTVNGWPYVKLADDDYLRICDCYVDVIRGTILHGGKLALKGEVVKSQPSHVMW